MYVCGWAAALPSLALVVAARAARSGLGIGAGWAQARLSPLVELVVERRLFWLTTGVDLVAGLDPEWALAALEPERATAP